MSSKKMLDLRYGNKKENQLLPKLEEHFGVSLTKTGRYDVFDYINEEKKILIELKSRRNSLNQFPTTMIGLNKFEEGYKKRLENYTIYFVFNFSDYLGYYKLKGLTEVNFDIRDGGRRDRGKDEIKKYVFIPVNELLII
jgi:hypothetical protein